jgi:hypothetical protein
MARIMLDRRCPRCDAPVRGREEVVLLVSLAAEDKEVKECPHCKTPIRLSDEKCDLGGLYYTDEVAVGE